MDIFNYNNYKLYLSDLIKSKPRGYQSLLAKVINCQASYLIQVLTNKNELSEDQAFKASVFLNFSKQRRDFFMLLVSASRATTLELQAYYNEKVSRLRAQQENIKNCVPESNEIDIKISTEYYSNWDVSIVHLATSTPHLQKPEAIAERFRLSLKRVNYVLNFLVQNNLVELVNKKFIFKGSSIYLEKESPLNQLHQINRRDQSLRSLRENDQENIHFASSFVITKKEFADLKKDIKTLIENSHKKIIESPSEEVYSLVIDLFKVI